MTDRSFIAPSLALILSACAMPTPPADEPGDASGSAGTTDDTGGPQRPGRDPEQAAECTELRAATEGLLRKHCAECHDNGKTQGSLGQISDLDRLIETGVITRGKSEGSVLFGKVERGEMPLGGAPLTGDELAVLAGWIDVCTPADQESADVSLNEPPSCLDNPFTRPGDVLEAIRDDINDLDQAQAVTTRYLTITHLYNAGYCETQIEGYRHALAKLLNHLSQNPEIRTPQAIDAARTIYRIDLDDYGWTEATWAAITAADPYAIDFQGEDARSIQADAGDVALFSVKGDWFLDAASQPPLYHEILQIPDNRFDLEERLGVDVAKNIAQELALDGDSVVRAGFMQSKVSDFNRVIERHQLPSASYRAYWLSYDFGSNNDIKSIFDHPLDFVQDGGEIIFHLPNGLQAYMLVDKDGARLDEGPTNIVHDQETPEEPIVINGLSCMSCHSEGMRLATDEVAGVVADNTEFDALVQEQVARLYGPAETFNRKQQQDVQTFAAALAQTGAPSRVGSNEPVMAAHLAFNAPIDLRRAAAELGLSEAELLKNVGKLKGLSKIDRTTVDRETFQVNFAANACLLRLGITAAPECGAPPAGQ